MTSAARAPGAGTAVFKWQPQHDSDAQKEGVRVVFGASSVSSDPVSFLMSSSIFLVVNSSVLRVRRGKDGRPVRTRFSFRDDDTTTVEDCFELVEVEITVSRARCSPSGNDGFFDGQLDDEGLHDA